MPVDQRTTEQVSTLVNSRARTQVIKLSNKYLYLFRNL